MKRRGFIVAGSLCALFVATVLLVELLPLDLSRWWLPAIFEPRRLIGIYAVILLQATWAVSVQLRASDRVVRHYLLVMSAFLVIWLFVLLLKRVTANPDVERICWYLFYPSIVGAALALFGCGVRVGFPRNARGRKTVTGIAATVSVVLVFLVLTNDLHYLAFRFDPASPLWSKEYTYGIVYYLTALWTVALTLGFFATLAIGLRRQGHRQLVPLVVVFLAGLLYCLAYFLRVPFIFTSNFTVFYCMLFMLFVELCLDLKLLPSCAWYGTVFRRATHNAQVLSSRLVREYASDSATALPDAVTERIALQTRQGNETLRIGIADEPDTVYDVFPVHGGWAVVAEDISEICRLRAQLQERTEQLQRSTALLGRQLAIQRQLLRQRAENELLSEVDASIAGAVEHISSILDDLPPGDTPAECEQRRRALMLVKLLVAYCKRKGSLVLIEKEGASVSRARLELMYDETNNDLATVGIESGALIEAEHLPARATSLLYDCFYDLILIAFDCSDPIIMSYIEDSADAGVEMHVTLQCADDVDLSCGVAAATLAENLGQRGISYDLEGDVGTLTLCVRAGGEHHA